MCVCGDVRISVREEIVGDVIGGGELLRVAPDVDLSRGLVHSHVVLSRREVSAGPVSERRTTDHSHRGREFDIVDVERLEALRHPVIDCNFFQLGFCVHIEGGD